MTRLNLEDFAIIRTGLDLIQRDPNLGVVKADAARLHALFAGMKTNVELIHISTADSVLIWVLLDRESRNPEANDLAHEQAARLKEIFLVKHSAQEVSAELAQTFPDAETMPELCDKPNA